jgi:hypothetical protein
MRRGVFSVSDEEIMSRASRQELDLEIRRCLHGYEHGGTSQGRKAFYDRLVWLEKIRESVYGVQAKKRRFGRR